MKPPFSSTLGVVAEGGEAGVMAGVVAGLEGVDVLVTGSSRCLGGAAEGLSGAATGSLTLPPPGLPVEVELFGGSGLRLEKPSMNLVNQIS